MALDFLLRASWGANADEIDTLVDTDAADWLRAEFAKGPSDLIGYFDSSASIYEQGPRGDYRKLWWDDALSGRADLRARATFALSQILVASGSPSANQDAATRVRMSVYLDVLSRHAFGNYRDLLEEVTYTPHMGEFLTYFGNRKADEDGSRQPDENYARDIMQLFTIGLVELNMDGTPKLGADGQPVETYTNADVQGLARVFTGLAYPEDTPGSRGLTSRPGAGTFGMMEVWPEYHSQREKSFLGLTIPAGTPGEDSIDQALDHLFDHPNVAPFVSRLLIQRFTASSPTPDYVERVATAFATGAFTTPTGERFGTGERGDMQATLAAILLDAQFFDDRPPGPTDGKIREPILRWAQWARSAEVENLIGSNEWRVFNTMPNTNTGLSQGVGQSPSVFNFYRSGFRLPGSASAEAEQDAPELQLVNEAALRGYYDYMYAFVVDNTTRVDRELDSFHATYPTLRSLADDPEAMVDHLDATLISGTFEPTTRQRMIDALELAPLREDRFDEELGLDTDRYSRAKIAVYMAVTSHEYGMQY